MPKQSTAQQKDGQKVEGEKSQALKGKTPNTNS